MLVIHIPIATGFTLGINKDKRLVLGETEIQVDILAIHLFIHKRHGLFHGWHPPVMEFCKAILIQLLYLTFHTSYGCNIKTAPLPHQSGSLINDNPAITRIRQGILKASLRILIAIVEIPLFPIKGAISSSLINYVPSAVKPFPL